MKMKYPVIIHKSKYGYDVECPILPGCVSQGDTFEEALENIKDAIKTYLETIEELNKRKLGKNKKLEYVEVVA
jgi:predicted RNase H-like HicB family nuclease